MEPVRRFERYEDNIDHVKMVSVQTAGYQDLGVYLTSVISNVGDRRYEIENAAQARKKLGHQEKGDLNIFDRFVKQEILYYSVSFFAFCIFIFIHR